MVQVLDPVCGMTIEAATAARSTEYEGNTYFFCAPGCQKAFERNPQQYLAVSQKSEGDCASSESSSSCSCCKQ